jgi:NitT/TauT family transport system substrate-binding protein
MSHMKKIIFAIVFIATATAGALFFSYLAYKGALNSRPPLSAKISIGWNAWPGVLPYLVAKEKGYFEAEGLAVELVFKESYSDMVSDLLERKIQLAPDMVFVDVIERSLLGHNLAVVAVTDFSNGADVIFAASEFTSLKQLAGKKIAVEKGTMSEYLLYYALKQAGLNFGDVALLDLSSAEGTDKFINGEVDAAVVYGVDISRIEKAKIGKQIFSSAETPGLISDCLVGLGDYVRKNPTIVRAVIRASFRGLEYINQHPQQSYLIGAKYFKLSAPEFSQQMAGLQLLDLRGNQTAFSYSSGYRSLYGSGKMLTRILDELGIYKSDFDWESLINPAFIKEY